MWSSKPSSKPKPCRRRSPVVIIEALLSSKPFINRTGTAHGWDVLFYFFSFLKGIRLFTVNVLIGTGWSFVKPFLQVKKKRILMIVIPLQVVANVALVFYVFTGYNFRPEVRNPYFAIDVDEKEAALDLSKIDDDFEL